MRKKDSAPKKEKKSKQKKRLFRKKSSTDQLIRIEELEELLRKEGGDVDPEKIVSMYQPHRRRRKIGAALLRMDKLSLVLLAMMLLVAVLFIAAFMQEKMGNFTINLDRLELYRRGISIADNGNFDDATARLTAATVKDATNISIDDLPDDLDSDKGGNHNGKNYMAYTYYVRNAGKEDLSYVARITLDSCSKGAENAVRVAVWRNGKRTVYAEPAADGYTIVIWMEGDDPECVDSIIGGSVELSMHIDTDFDDDTSLLWKFVQDIKDTISGDKPINASGNKAPNDSYYTDKEVTWKNRRNK